MCRVQLIHTGNRHVMTDESGREYFYHPKKQGWFPGEKRKGRFLWTNMPGSKSYRDKGGSWFYTEGRFCNRTLPFPTVGGTMLASKTRYTYATYTRPDEAPNGRNGQPYKMASVLCRRAIWFDGQRFWKVGNVRLEDGSWLNNTLLPFSGEMWDAYELQSEDQNIPVLRIWCDDGVPYRAVHRDFGDVWDTSDELGELVDWLRLVTPDVEESAA